VGLQIAELSRADSWREFTHTVSKCQRACRFMKGVWLGEYTHPSIADSAVTN
jgi:hypothetical protein